jgi:hypothetical protein
VLFVIGPPGIDGDRARSGGVGPTMVVLPQGSEQSPSSGEMQTSPTVSPSPLATENAVGAVRDPDAAQDGNDGPSDPESSPIFDPSQPVPTATIPAPTPTMPAPTQSPTSNPTVTPSPTPTATPSPTRAPSPTATPTQDECDLINIDVELLELCLG